MNRLMAVWCGRIGGERGDDEVFVRPLLRLIHLVHVNAIEFSTRFSSTESTLLDMT
jgi:hypothetical protein